MTPQRPLSPAALPPPSPAALIRNSTVVYGAMTALGLAVMAMGHRSLPAAVALPRDPYELLRLAAIGGLAAVVLLVLSYFFEDWFPSFRALKALIMRILGPVSVPMAFYLAAISAAGEEVMFRGAIQPYAGMVLTSLLFGLLHKGQRGLFSIWSLWAFIAGLLLAWMYAETGSLWPPIVAHFCVNLVSILNLRRAYHGWLAHMGDRQSSQGGPDKSNDLQA